VTIRVIQGTEMKNTKGQVLVDFFSLMARPSLYHKSVHVEK
jgi:hypothetical protein